MSGCHVNNDIADVNRAFDTTWHDSTYAPGDPERVISMSFNGSAVYAFVLLANQIPRTTTFTNLTFHIDGALAGQFNHLPDSSTDILYNVPVFAHTGLSYTSHEFEIHMGGSGHSLLLFDYVVYTVELENLTQMTPTSTQTQASSSSFTSIGHPITSKPLTTGLIIASVFGGLALVIAAGMSFHMFLRRRLAAPMPDSNLALCKTSLRDATLSPGPTREFRSSREHSNPESGFQ